MLCPRGQRARAARTELSLTSQSSAVDFPAPADGSPPPAPQQQAGRPRPARPREGIGRSWPRGPTGSSAPRPVAERMVTSSRCARGSRLGRSPTGYEAGATRWAQGRGPAPVPDPLRPLRFRTPRRGGASPSDLRSRTGGGRGDRAPPKRPGRQTGRTAPGRSRRWPGRRGECPGRSPPRAPGSKQSAERAGGPRARNPSSLYSGLPPRSGRARSLRPRVSAPEPRFLGPREVCVAGGARRWRGQGSSSRGSCCGCQDGSPGRWCQGA